MGAILQLQMKRLRRYGTKTNDSAGDSLAVMNMLVGVLCEIVSMVASVEREELTVTYVRDMLLEMLRTGGLDASVKVAAVRISRGAFQELLMMPPAVRIIQEIGVDVVGLVDFADFVFEGDTDLTFEEFMELVLQLRGTNSSTVKDIVDLRRYIMKEMVQLGNDIKKVELEIRGNFDGVHRILESLVLRTQQMPQLTPKLLEENFNLFLTDLGKCAKREETWGSAAPTECSLQVPEMSASATTSNELSVLSVPAGRRPLGGYSRFWV